MLHRIKSARYQETLQIGFFQAQIIWIHHIHAQPSPDSGMISSLGCIILGNLCGDMAAGSKDELMGSEDEDDGVEVEEAPKHGSGNSPGESRILGDDSVTINSQLKFYESTLMSI